MRTGWRQLRKQFDPMEHNMRKRIASAALALFLLPAAATRAAALDCADAKTPLDRALCADPSAKAADAAMTKAYEVLSARLKDSAKDQLLQSQRTWLKSRTYLCPDRGKELATCLVTINFQRQRFLEGLPETGPGSGGALKPIFIEAAGRKGYYAIDVTALKYAPATSAGEKLFNAEVDKLLKQVPSGKNDDASRWGMTYSFILHMEMAYASPKLISAHIFSYQFAGGAHGNSGKSNINIDATKGKLLTFADVFADGAKPKIDAECLQQILKAKAERSIDEKIAGEKLTQLKTAIDEGLSKLDSWSFSTSGATVDYDPYALGAYVEGFYSCKFTPAFLRPLVKAGFLVP